MFGNTHTHTHTHTYIYIYIYKIEDRFKMVDFIQREDFVVEPHNLFNIT